MFSIICACQFLSIDKHATIHINIEVRYRIRDQWEEDNPLKKGKQKAQLQRDREDWDWRIKCGGDRREMQRTEYEEEQLTFISILWVSCRNLLLQKLLKIINIHERQFPNQTSFSTKCNSQCEVWVASFYNCQKKFYALTPENSRYCQNLLIALYKLVVRPYC